MANQRSESVSVSQPKRLCCVHLASPFFDGVDNHTIIFSGREPGMRLRVQLLACLWLPKQLFQGSLNGLLARVTNPFVSYQALVIDDVERRRCWRIPSFGNRTIIGEIAPVELMGVHHFL